MESIIFYLFLFMIGIIVGDIITTIMYRISLQPNRTHKHSYCRSCKHALSVWDKIPLISYLLLGGKCRYCKQKISSYYIMLELLTGSLFVLFAMSLNITFPIFEISKLMYCIVGILYIIGIILIAGIDKEKRQIKKTLIVYEIIIISIYMMYQYAIEKANINRYGIYLLLIGICFLIENILLKKKLKDYYPLEILELSIVMAMFGYEMQFVCTVILTLLILVLGKIGKGIRQNMNKVAKKEESYYQNLPIGYYLCFANISIILVVNWIACRM